MATNAQSWTIGFLGYGEVGRILAEDLRSQNINVCAYDIKLSTNAEAELKYHAQLHKICLMHDHAALAASSDLIISAVTASQTEVVATACATGIRSGTFFLDLNSASPNAKQMAAITITLAGGNYVEGAVMTSVPPYRISVPLLLGGKNAASLNVMLNSIGFNSIVSSEKLGRASSVKMCRSVIIKGLEAMIIESFTTARAYGVENEVIASLYETFPGIDWEKQATYFFQRVIEHGKRRSEEMAEVMRTVADTGLTPYSAEATFKRQQWGAELSDAGFFGIRGSKNFARSDDWRTEADRILKTLNR